MDFEKTYNMLNTIEFKLTCINQHDVVCNQKYDDTLPYSFHLEAVAKQIDLFSDIIRECGLNRNNLICGAYGHDLIEDARMTYNDVVKHSNTEVADIVYCCTEEKGKDRHGRHNHKYFDELKVNREAVFVKLCDVIANVKYSLLTNSSMYNKYKKEYPELRSHLYRSEFQDIFEYIERLFLINVK